MMLKPTATTRALFFIIFDILISLFTLYLSYELRFNFQIDKDFMQNFSLIAFVLISLKILSFAYFKIYQVAWRYFSLNEAKKLLQAHLIAYIFFAVIYYLFPQYFNPFPRSIIIIDFFLSMIFVGFLRILKRLIIESGGEKTLKKTLLLGASPLSQTILKQNSSYYISHIVDDDKMVIGTYFTNIKVKSIDKVEQILENKKIETIIIAKEFSQKKLKEFTDIFNKFNIHDIKILSLSNQQTTLKQLSIEDLLARSPKDLDTDAIKKFIKGKVILITGAGGSIGSELSIQCNKFEAKKLILLDHSEYNLYKIEQELEGTDIVPILQNITDKEQLEKVFATNKIDIVLHAAAYKHVPLVEENIEAAIKNNIIGTKNCIDLSIKYRVKKFVLISTDKAVRPTNVMGVTKRVCELYAQNINPNKTEVVSVRFGNVLGSSGSVIPKFKKQIEKGGPITVTHPNITRYFMLIPEACLLVLQAASLGKGGEIFILDMGEPVKIVDLAKKMCKLSGKNDIEIKFTGLRQGEKLYEELLINDADYKTEYDSITIAKPTHYDIDTLKNDIEDLLSCRDKLSKLKQIVPEFNHQNNTK